MNHRFNFFDQPKDIFEHADQIEVKLHRIDGKLAIEFKVSGGYWPEDDEDTGDTCCQSRPEAAELARDLLSRFVKGGAE